MFWADKLLENVKGPQVINDSWTPSGVIHMGSLKGPVIHDVLYKILKERGGEVKFMYGFDDADPVDGLPPDLQKSHSKYLGLPLFKTPSPDGKGKFGDFYSNKMKKLLYTLGVIPTETYKTSELYRKGIFNKAISFVLDHASEIRKVYAEMYKKKIADDWYPLQVICSNCGKIGTTKVTGWDGKQVNFCCEKNLVKWAQGCGICGKISPFDGNSKMLYKVEWAAKWWTFKVTIEGAGKDHASAGGTYDVARKIIKDVFHQEPPLWLPYEYFLYNGKKMSSSKGIGLNAEQLLEVLPSAITRFLMIKTSPNQAIEFNPNGTLIISKLFDDYQAVALSKDALSQRVLKLSRVSGAQKTPTVRFQTLAQWVQMPNMEPEIKKESLEEWAKYARIWVEKYAPESEKFLAQKQLPVAAKDLSAKQKEFLRRISSELDKRWEAEEFQKQLYEWAKEFSLSSKDAFSAIYLSLIGKDHGPKAAWLILSLDKEFVKKRFNELK